jgi:hypothetical protein
MFDMSQFKLTQELFPIPIYNHVVHDVNSIQEEIQGAIGNAEFGQTPIVWTKWGTTVDVTDVNANVIDKLNLTKFKAELDKHLRIYCSAVGFVPPQTEYPYKMTSWFTKLDPGHATHIHNHNYFDIAGAYYFKTNGKDGDIYFECPNPNVGSYVFQNYATRTRINPSVGRLVLFPGWISHGVTKNFSSESRIGLSFSVMFERVC